MSIHSRRGQNPDCRDGTFPEETPRITGEKPVFLAACAAFLRIGPNNGDCSTDTGHGNSAPKGPDIPAQGNALGLEVQPTSSPETAGHRHGDVAPFQGSGIDIRPIPRALPWADL